MMSRSAFACHLPARTVCRRPLASATDCLDSHSISHSPTRCTDLKVPHRTDDTYPCILVAPLHHAADQPLPALPVRRADSRFRRPANQQFGAMAHLVVLPDVAGSDGCPGMRQPYRIKCVETTDSAHNQPSRMPAERLGFDPRNTAPQTRARYRYQDECIAVAVLSHLESEDLDGVILEFSTDAILLPKAGLPELVSIKHREPNQLAETSWSWTSLRKQNVLRDLYDAWNRCDRECSVAFWSNGGFSGATYALWQSCAQGRQPKDELIRQLAANIGASRADAVAFIDALSIPENPLPRRNEISAVGIRMAWKYVQAIAESTEARAELIYRNLVEKISELSNDDATTKAISATLRTSTKDPAAARLRAGFLSRSVITGIMSDEQDTQFRSKNTDNPDPLGWVQDALFVGRDRHLDMLRASFRFGSRGDASPVVLHGTPGCGKTSLAMQFAAMQSGVKPILINAVSRAAVLRDLGKLALGLDSSYTNSGLPMLDSPVTLSLPGDSRTLYIFDGVTDADTLKGIVPRAAKCRVLITSTVPFIDLGYDHILVEGWERHESHAFIQRAMPGIGETDSEKLAAALHDHPLALVQAASYCRTTDTSVAHFLDRLTNEPLRALDLGHAPGHPGTVVRTIQLNSQALRERDSVAGEVLNLLSFFGADDIQLSIFEGRWPIAYVDSAGTSQRPLGRWRLLQRRKRDQPQDANISPAGWALMRALQDDDIRERAFQALRASSLAQSQDARFRVHPLVALVIRTGMADTRPWLEVGLGALSMFIPEDGDEMSIADSNLHHIVSLISYALDGEHGGPIVVVGCIFLSHRLAMLGIDIGSRTAVEFAETGMRLARRSVDQGRLPISALLAQRHAAARAYFASGRVNKAIEVLEENFDLGVANQSQLIMLRAISGIASIVAEAGDPELVRHVFNRLPPADILDSHVRLDVDVLRVSLLQRLNRMSEAATILNRIQEDIRDSDLIVTPDTLEEIARVGADMARYSNDPESSFERAMEILNQRKLRRGQHADGSLLAAYCGAADAAIDGDKLKEADQILSEAKEVADLFEGRSNHYHYLAVLGRLYFVQGKHPRALPILTDAVSGLEASPTARGHLAPALLHLGQALALSGRFDEGIRTVERACEVDSDFYGPKHPETLIDLQILDAMRKSKQMGVRRR